MSYRFTNTEKWNDAWFCELKPISKLLFLYLCDQCDLAGFLEINAKKISFDLGLGKQEVESAFKGVDDKINYSKDKKYLFVRNFLKHQKNYPLNEKSTTYKKVVELLKEKLLYFDYKTINDFFEWGINGASMGHQCPNGIGIGIGNKENNTVIHVEDDEEKENWRTDFEIYKQGVISAFREVEKDDKFVKKMQKYHNNLDILLTIEKACVNFWATEEGWNHKKKSKGKKINWRTTFQNTLDVKFNKVYKND